MNYQRLVPRDSFMGRYLAYMQSQETAHIYDFWCGLWCISTACGRNAYVARPRAPVFLNLYIVLVGESGVPRKTTAVNTAARVVRGIVGVAHGRIPLRDVIGTRRDATHPRRSHVEGGQVVRFGHNGGMGGKGEGCSEQGTIARRGSEG